MQIFARLTKVNEAERTVEGVIADETPDLAGEIFDYAKSKPHFQSWSEEIAKATEGKSVGNVRVMHGNTVAGVTKHINFDDEAKAITVKAHIVDDNEWKKTLAGCYAGFSIGGKYGETWADGAHKRYSAIPREYSLVDLPCNPSARFTVVKADGSQELRKFETTTDDTEAVLKWADSLPVAIHNALLAKIAERNESTGDPATVAATEEEDAMNAELQKAHDETKAELAKAADDLAKIAGELTAAKDELAKAGEALTKLTAERDAAIAERDELTKGVEEIKAEIERQKKAWAEQAAKPKGAARVVEKTLGTDPVEGEQIDDKPVMKADGSVDHMATAQKMAKLAYRQPMRVPL